MSLNVALVLCSRSFAKWGSYDQEAHGDLMALALAAPAVVTTIPLYWRSEPWQAALALPLLFLPWHVSLGFGGHNPEALIPAPSRWDRELFQASPTLRLPGAATPR